MSPPSPRSVLAESVPVAAVLLFWVVVSWFVTHQLLSTGARAAGVVMALAYALVRGIALADRADHSPEFGDVGTVLRVNGRALLAAGGWFALAWVVLLLEQLWGQLGAPGAFTSPADGLAFALTATGVVTVVLYAVAFVAAAVRGASSPDRPATSTESAAGD